MNENEEFEENKIKLKDNKIIHLPLNVSISSQTSLTVKLVSKRLGFGTNEKHR